MNNAIIVAAFQYPIYSFNNFFGLPQFESGLNLDLPVALLYIPMSKLHTCWILMNNVRPKILLIRFSSLGDLVLLTALIDGIAEAFPGHDLHMATKEEYSELFDGNAHIAKIHTLPAASGFTGLLGLRKGLVQERFDIIIDAHNVLRSNFLYRTLGARRKVQLGKDHVRKLSIIRAGKDLYTETISMKDRYLDLLGRLDVEVPALPTRLTPPPAAEAAADAYLEENGLTGRTIVALSPGARWETKRWQSSGFADVASAMSDSGHATLVIGTGTEKDICPYMEGSVNACGKLSLMETAAVLGKAAVLVTNDSAPLHIAEAVGTPVVALFGPTVRQFGYFPLLEKSETLEKDIDCRPCSRNGSRQCHIEKRDCLDTIDPGEVIAAVSRILGTTGEKE